MHRKLIGTTAVICLACLGSMALLDHHSVSQAASEAETHWEHLALSNDLRKDAADKAVGGRINQLGSEGWQLVDVESIDEDGTTIKTVYYFKRQG